MPMKAKGLLEPGAMHTSALSNDLIERLRAEPPEGQAPLAQLIELTHEHNATQVTHRGPDAEQLPPLAAS